jgi:hypothetical protein
MKVASMTDAAISHGLKLGCHEEATLGEEATTTA